MKTLNRVTICMVMFSAFLISCDKNDNPTPQAARPSNSKSSVKEEVEDRPKTVKGKIKTVHNNAIQNATILLYLNGSTLIGATASDSLGNYQFTNVTGGTYQLKYSASGYQDLSDWESIPYNDDYEYLLADIVLQSE